MVAQKICLRFWRLCRRTKAPAWNELWSRVCHQGTTYSASLAVLPCLLDVASTWHAPGRVMPLALAGAIVSAPESSDKLPSYEPSIQALHLLALETLPAPELSRFDRIYAMQAALALGGDYFWGRALDYLESGEFPGSCPSCGTEIYIVVGKYGFFCTAQEWVRNPQAHKIKIEPQVEKLAETGKWLHEAAMAAGDEGLAEWIGYLFGTTVCPNCRKFFQLPAAITPA
jgi:hypothetical protein